MDYVMVMFDTDLNWQDFFWIAVIVAGFGLWFAVQIHSELAHHRTLLNDLYRRPTHRHE